MRKGFNFYLSYYEIMDELDDVSIPLFIKSLMNVQFMKVHIDDITFDDKISSMAWKSIKQSIRKQLEGYCSAENIKYSSLFDAMPVPPIVPPEGAMPVPHIQVQGEVQGEVQVQVDNNAPLRSAIHTDNKQKQKRTKLKSNEQWVSYINETYEDDAINYAIDFISYREQISEPIKTAQAISLYMNEVINIHEKFGSSMLNREIDRMKAGAWKTLYPEYKNKGK